MKKFIIIVFVIFILQNIFSKGGILITDYNIFRSEFNFNQTKLPEIIQDKNGKWFIDKEKVKTIEEGIITIDKWKLDFFDDKNYFLKVSVKSYEGYAFNFTFAVYLSTDKSNIAAISITSPGLNNDPDTYFYSFYKIQESGIIDVTDKILPKRYSGFFKDGFDLKAIEKSFNKIDKDLNLKTFFDLYCDIPKVGTLTKIKLIRQNMDLNAGHYDGKNKDKIEKIDKIIENINSNIIRKEVSLNWNNKKGIFEMVK